MQLKSGLQELHHDTIEVLDIAQILYKAMEV
jgi:hypothetical protein